MAQREQIDVYTDGECPLCRWMRSRVEPLDKARRIKWLNFREPDVLVTAAPRTFDDLNEEMHVKLPDGVWLKGFPAWIEVLRVLPAWSWVVPALTIPGISRAGEALYRWVAKRRFSLFGVPPPCSPDGVCMLHKPR